MVEISTPFSREIYFTDEFEREWRLVDEDGRPVLGDKNYADVFGDVFAVDLGSARGMAAAPLLTVRWKSPLGVPRQPWVVAHATAAELMPGWSWVGMTAA